ncbi:MAG TPA: hypothetical protein VK680_01545 [Solirubrobacteraceae bacterium]|jgi:hypothetical protein|nr:hypothetical protein [Solirubrobacteraceae bacterium]
MTIGGPGPGVSGDSCIAGELIARADLDSASRAIRGSTVRTPTLACAELTEIAGTAAMPRPSA